MNFEVKFTENQKHTTVGFNEGQESIVADFSENQANFDTEFTENQKQSNIQFNANESRTEIDFGTFKTLQGVGITKIEKTSVDGIVDTYTITLTNGKTYSFTVTNGIVGKDGKDGKDGVNGKDGLDGTNGVDGVGILNIAKTTTNGNVDTYVITLTNGNTYSFTVTNGENGKDGKDGKDGANGVDGKDGANGKDGVDGISASHSWNGTILTITSASGTSSADLKGADGKDGKDGVNGKDGANGQDYVLTEEDKTEIAEQAKELIDLSSYQPKTDETLETDNEKVVGAINELLYDIIGTRNFWVLDDITKRVLESNPLVYDFNFVSNGKTYNRLKYYSNDSSGNYFYLAYQYISDATYVNEIVYEYVNGVGHWYNTDYRIISTLNNTASLNAFLEDIATKTRALSVYLDTTQKSLVGAINELNADVKGVKNDVVAQAYYNEADGKWYEDIDFTVIIPNISLFNITLDFNKKDVYFALGKVNLSDWFATAEKHTALANGVNAFQKAYDNTIEKIFGTKNEELETESKIIVGAVNELNKKITSKAVDLTGKTYYIPSGWEVRAGYGQFAVSGSMTVVNTNDTTTTYSFSGLKFGYTYSAQEANTITTTSMSRVPNEKEITVTFTGGADVTNTALIDWLDTWGTLESPYQTKHDENLETESKEIVGAINEVNDKINATGGGSSLPSCDSTNNGQFLMVVNGVPTWTTVPNAEGVGF